MRAAGVVVDLADRAVGDRVTEVATAEVTAKVATAVVTTATVDMITMAAVTVVMAATITADMVVITVASRIYFSDSKRICKIHRARYFLSCKTVSIPAVFGDLPYVLCEIFVDPFSELRYILPSLLSLFISD